MARIDTKKISESLKLTLEKEANERSISLNELTSEIFEEHAIKKLRFESEKKFTDSLNNVAIAINRNTKTLEDYIETNIDLINILTD